MAVYALPVAVWVWVEECVGYVYFVEVEFELELGEFGEWGGDVEDVADGVCVGVVYWEEGVAE